jgi:hypothetical protein
MDRLKCRLASALAVLFVFLCFGLAAYVAGYWFGGPSAAYGAATSRSFRWRWTCAVYAPAARLESTVRGIHVGLFYPRGPDFDCYAVYSP